MKLFSGLARVWMVVLIFSVPTVDPTLVLGQITGGMLNPRIDVAGEPFSYFWHPTDVIGTLYAPVATEVTPEGYLYTGFGELMFFVGNPPEPVYQRIKTLWKGYLPIVQYHLRQHDVEYKFTMFAADLGGLLKGLPVNFVQVQLENEAKESRTAFLSSAYRFSPPTSLLHSGPADYRFQQRFDLIPEKYAADQTQFDPNWKYSLGANALIRDGRDLYFFPINPAPYQSSLGLGDNGLRAYRYFSGEIEEDPHPKYVLDPHTPMGVVTYRVVLEPGHSESLVFKMPIAPLPDGSVEATEVNNADYSYNFQSIASSWEQLVSKSAPLRFPEAKVQEALLANTIFNLLAIDKVGDDYITNVNKFQYHGYYGGSDVSHMRIGFDYMGLEQIAKETILYTIKQQSPDGSFRDDQHPTLHYWEFFGWNLWCLGRHYQLTRDTSFLRQVYPTVQRAMEWEEQVTRTDSMGLMPPFTVPDDAGLKDTRQTGQDLWTLVGLKNAIAMAKDMGKSEDVRRFEADYQRFREAFEKQLATQTAKTGGYIPPAIERTLAGNNWDNLLTLYPEPLFDPFDPRVTATIRNSRNTYAEGILSYTLPTAASKRDGTYVFNSTPGLHYWQSVVDAENELVRGDLADQELAVKDLYALLLHTSSTHLTQEFGSIPWSTRDIPEGDILPDGNTSGRLIEFMRNMLVREYKNDLFLFSAISPAWLEPGKSVEVTNEPTAFGPVTAVLRASAEGWDVRLSNRFRQAPDHVIIPVPWFYEVQQAEADGYPIKITAGELVIPANTQEVRVRGRIKPGTPPMSFELAVEEYSREYNKRYEEFLQTGTTRP